MAGGGGLSQDDFRKLLATPRPGAAVDRDATPASRRAAHTPREISSASSGFAKPDVPARAKKRWKKPVNEQEAEPKYRDRASERRTGINPDYAESEQILATLQKTAEEQNQSVAYEQSKYLGGDVEYTHLVKGLDFALLNKVKAQLERKAASKAAAVGDAAPAEQTQTAQQRDIRDEDLEAAAAEAAARAKAGEEKTVCAVMDADFSGKPEFRSKFAERVFEAGMAATHRQVLVRNELFRPGRMAFNFELADELGGYRDAFAIPTTLVRSKTDPKVLKHSSAQLPGGNEFVLDKVLQVVSQARAPVAARAQTSEKRAGIGKKNHPFATKVENERPSELIIGM
ncbi:MAG: RED-like protein N-terminal region-domain-containing protein, partial [Olpidium bornovanus]